MMSAKLTGLRIERDRAVTTPPAAKYHNQNPILNHIDNSIYATDRT